MARVPGATLMSRMYPNLVERTSRMILAGYSYPTWWDAIKAAPPKDLYNEGRARQIRLPTDPLVKTLMRRIPMLKTEPFEKDERILPLSLRFAQTQLRLMKVEKMSEGDAFNKCEKEIFAEEIQEFASVLRKDMNHIPLSYKDSRITQLHNLIDQQIAKNRGDKNVETYAESETKYEQSRTQPILDALLEKKDDMVAEQAEAYKLGEKMEARSKLLLELDAYITGTPASKPLSPVVTERVDGMDWDLFVAKHSTEVSRKEKKASVDMSHVTVQSIVDKHSKFTEEQDAPEASDGDVDPALEMEIRQMEGELQPDAEGTETVGAAQDPSFHWSNVALEDTQKKNLTASKLDQEFHAEMLLLMGELQDIKNDEARMAAKEGVTLNKFKRFRDTPFPTRL